MCDYGDGRIENAAYRFAISSPAQHRQGFILPLSNAKKFYFEAEGSPAGGCPLRANNPQVGSPEVGDTIVPSWCGEKCNFSGGGQKCLDARRPQTREEVCLNGTLTKRVLAGNDADGHFLTLP